MTDLDTLRHHIDDIDKSILDLLEIRMRVTDQVGQYKKDNNISILQKGREDSLKEKLQAQTKHPILKDKIDSIFDQIIEVSKLSMHILHLKDSPFSRVGIIGLGVIGGSIAKTLKAKNKNIILSTLKRNSNDIKIALQNGILDKEYESIELLVENNDLIILASPIDTIEQLADKIAEMMTNKKIVVIDVASVKGEISKIFEKNSHETIEFLPTHPMAGSELMGFEGSTIGMFLDKPWVICPHTKSNASTIEQIKIFIESLGSKTVLMDAAKHDVLVGIVSHLIFLMSTYLFAFSQSVPESLAVAGSGFESTTRLTSGNTQMHAEIVEKNFNNVEKGLQRFIEYIQKNPVTKENAKEFFERNKNARDKFINK